MCLVWSWVWALQLYKQLWDTADTQVGKVRTLARIEAGIGTAGIGTAGIEAHIEVGIGTAGIGVGTPVDIVLHKDHSTLVDIVSHKDHSTSASYYNNFDYNKMDQNK